MLKNPFLVNLEKIEYVISYACTGKCKHCSEGDHENCIDHIDAKTASQAVEKIASIYDIKTVMTFGGEPLLFPETVYEIISAAKRMNIPKRQVITNGYFSTNVDVIKSVSQKLSESGVNDLLLSVDAFHQETIPLDTVKIFAKELQKCSVPIRLQPAWLVSRDNDNPYNKKTREILDSFKYMEIYENDGNIVFPEGNAKKYLSEYFLSDVPDNPYVEDPLDVKCISFSPNGDVLDSNIYREDITTITKNYTPKR